MACKMTRWISNLVNWRERVNSLEYKNFMFLREQLEKHEGLRLKVYKCPAGRWTIGIGRNLEDNGITVDEAHYLLDNDIGKVVMTLKQKYGWFDSLDDVRKATVINMAFNLGIAGFGKFHQTIDAVKDKRYGQAATCMLQSKWSRQVGNRAIELSEQMRTGKFSSK